MNGSRTNKKGKIEEYYNRRQTCQHTASEKSPGSILSRVVLWALWAPFCPFMVIFTALLALLKLFKLFKEPGGSLAHFSFKAAFEPVISS
jgi:hypothetical protein